MKIHHRIALVVALVLAILVTSWGTLFAAVYATGGVLTVSMDPGPDGGRFHLAVPVALVDAAAVTGRSVVAAHGDASHLRLEAHLGEWQPMVQELLRVLDECPDATLVEVEDGEDHVRVVKRRGKIVVEVDDSEINLRVSVPTRALARTARRLMS